MIFCAHVVAVILGAKLAATTELLQRPGFVLLLPWEFQLLDGMKYLLVDVGLELGPFLVMCLGAAWNAGITVSVLCDRSSLPEPLSGPHFSSRPTISRGPLGGSLLASLLAGGLSIGIGLAIWVKLREGDPRHQNTHIELGEFFRRDGQLEKAAEQYRAAIAEGTGSVRAWSGLEALRQQQALRN